MKKLLLIILTLLFTSVTVTGIEEDGRTNLQDIEYKQLVIQQHLQTQKIIAKEMSTRDARLEKDIKEYVNQNFVVLDKRIDSFIKKAAFKLGMVFFTGLVLGGTVLMLIQNQLKRKKAVKKKLVSHDEKMWLSGETLTRIREQSGEETIKKPLVEKNKKLMKEKLPAQKIVKEEKSFSSRTIEPLGDFL